MVDGHVSLRCNLELWMVFNEIEKIWKCMQTKEWFLVWKEEDKKIMTIVMNKITATYPINNKINY
jgi:hypothetical protein